MTYISTDIAHSIITLLCIVIVILCGALAFRKRTPASIIALAVSGCIAFFLAGSGIAAVCKQMTPPQGFVDTGVYVQERNFSAGRFTANDTTYVRLPLRLRTTQHEPALAYIVDGWLNQYQSRNYCRVENDSGFDLYCDDFRALFCAESHSDAVIAYYESCPIRWYLDNTPLSAEAAAAMDAAYSLKSAPFPQDDSEEHPKITALRCSADGVVLYDTCSISLIDGTPHLTPLLLKDGSRPLPLPPALHAPILTLFDQTEAAP